MFFIHDTPTTPPCPLSLHDALPIYLPAVVSSREALAAGAPLVHDSVPGNMVLDYESGDEAKARAAFAAAAKVVKLDVRSEEHTSELQSLAYLVCRLLLEKKKHTSTA